MERIRVRIIDADNGSWYEKNIFEVFEVYDYGRDYVVCVDYDRGYNSEWRHIKKEDSEPA